jgi:hypothetical protein
MFVTRRWRMANGYHVFSGLLVAIVVLVMIAGAFGRSHP